MAAIAHGSADPHRPEYVKIFQAHAARLAALAGEDGAWGPSLLNRRDYPLGETTATAGFVYGLAFGKTQRSFPRLREFKAVRHVHNGQTTDRWAATRTGLNQNLLTPRAHFLAVVSKGWAFLSSTALQADGLVGYCQPGGGSPVSAALGLAWTRLDTCCWAVLTCTGGPVCTGEQLQPHVDVLVLRRGLPARGEPGLADCGAAGGPAQD